MKRGSHSSRAPEQALRDRRIRSNSSLAAIPPGVSPACADGTSGRLAPEDAAMMADTTRKPRNRARRCLHREDWVLGCGEPEAFSAEAPARAFHLGRGPESGAPHQVIHVPDVPRLPSTLKYRSPGSDSVREDWLVRFPMGRPGGRQASQSGSRPLCVGRTPAS